MLKTTSSDEEEKDANLQANSDGRGKLVIYKEHWSDYLTEQMSEGLVITTKDGRVAAELVLQPVTREAKKPRKSRKLTADEA